MAGQAGDRRAAERDLRAALPQCHIPASGHCARLRLSGQCQSFRLAVGHTGTRLGLAFKERLTQLGPWTMSFNRYGEMLPRETNRATLHPTLVDRWGIPSLHIDCAWSANELAIHRDMNNSAAELLESAGATHIQPSTRGPSTPGNANHEMGTARMGRDARSSVLNGWNQSWDVPNLFVTDGACMTSSSCQNPSLTYMALTARACRYAVDELTRRNL